MLETTTVHEVSIAFEDVKLTVTVTATSQEQQFRGIIRLGNDVIWTGEELHDNQDHARRQANQHLTAKLKDLLT